MEKKREGNEVSEVEARGSLDEKEHETYVVESEITDRDLLDEPLHL